MLKHMNACALRTFVLVAVAAVGVSLISATAWADESKILKKDELKTLIATAKTSQDHQRVADHFTAMAERLEAEAKEHEELAGEYKRNPNTAAMKLPMSGRTAGHCNYFAKEMHKAAQQARLLAEDHQAMAKAAK